MGAVKPQLGPRPTGRDPSHQETAADHPVVIEDPALEGTEERSTVVRDQLMGQMDQAEKVRGKETTQAGTGGRMTLTHKEAHLMGPPFFGRSSERNETGANAPKQEDDPDKALRHDKRVAELQQEMIDQKEQAMKRIEEQEAYFEEMLELEKRSCQQKYQEEMQDGNQHLQD